MHDKRGISAFELQDDLGLKSYWIIWILLHKITEALRQRNEKYRLKNIIELEGTVFGIRQTVNQTEVLVAGEIKDWIDQKGHKRPKAGFAKVVVDKETKKCPTIF